MELKEVTVWTALGDGGDGSAYNRWYLTYEDAQKQAELDLEYGGWGEECIESVETFEGSDIHRSAISGSAEIKAEGA